ncbi:MAG: nucleotidyltransferase family protein [Proteobacteria bacterium]|nr:nucleotidyltransferase family protein [Pseudomonadota bacterium]
MKFRPEIEILIASSCVNPDADIQGKLRKLSVQGIDWDLLIIGSMNHKVMPLVYSNLKTYCSDLVPADVLERFRVSYLGNMVHNISLSDELCRVLDLFKVNGIPALTFKGPVLSEMAYGDMSCRMSSDLDILVSVHDAIRARDLLIEKGYLGDIDLTDIQTKLYVENENYFNLNKKELSVDLHWEMSGKYTLQPLHFGAFEMDLESISFQGCEVPSLCPEALIVYLSIHSSKHCWNHLEDLACMSSILRSHPSLNSEKMISVAKGFRSLRIFLTGLYLCSELFDVGVSDEIGNLVRNDKAVKRIGDLVIGNLFNDVPMPTEQGINWRFSLIHFRIRDNWFDAAHYALRLLFRPTIKEWLYFPLPAPLTFIHYLLRPFRLATEYFKASK